MINKKDFKARIMAAIKSNGGNCSVCNQYIDGNGGLSFANMWEIQVSWGKDELMLFIPKEITFTIPYADIKQYSVTADCTQIEIELSGRRLVSVRGLQ